MDKPGSSSQFEVLRSTFLEIFVFWLARLIFLLLASSARFVEVICAGWLANLAVRRLCGEGERGEWEEYVFGDRGEFRPGW